MSEAERGSTGDDSGRITPTPYNRRSSIERSSSTSGDWTSPIHGRRLPFTGGAEGRRPWWFWPALLATFVLSAIAWRPVLRPLVYGRRPHGGLEHAERVERDGASPHVHVFHEPRCAGESVTLKGAADLGVVHVADVVDAHVACMTKEDAKGRYIVTRDMVKIEEVFETLKTLYPSAPIAKLDNMDYARALRVLERAPERLGRPGAPERLGGAL